MSINNPDLIPKYVRIKRSQGEILQNASVYIGKSCKRSGWDLKTSKWFHISAKNDLEGYKQYVTNNLSQNLRELIGQTIGCFCNKLDNCHAKILIELVKNMMDKQQHKPNNDNFIINKISSEKNESCKYVTEFSDELIFVIENKQAKDTVVEEDTSNISDTSIIEANNDTQRITVDDYVKTTKRKIKKVIWTTCYIHPAKGKDEGQKCICKRMPITIYEEPVKEKKKVPLQCYLPAHVEMDSAPKIVSPKKLSKIFDAKDWASPFYIKVTKITKNKKNGKYLVHTIINDLEYKFYMATQTERLIQEKIVWIDKIVQVVHWGFLKDVAFPRKKNNNHKYFTSPNSIMITKINEVIIKK